MDRYLGSPPEDDPASLDATREAAESASWREHNEQVAAEPTQSQSSMSNSGCHPRRKGRSGKGYDSVTMSGLSASSRGSCTSYASHASWAGRKGKRKHPVRSKRGSTCTTTKYHCTWGCSSFSRAYEWQRHEESQHAPQVEWICLLDANPEDEYCAFCNQRNPSIGHYDIDHNALHCFLKSLYEHAFDRKDHLCQHIKQVHGQSEMPSRIGSWARPVANSIPKGGLEVWILPLYPPKLEEKSKPRQSAL